MERWHDMTATSLERKHDIWQLHHWRDSMTWQLHHWRDGMTWQLHHWRDSMTYDSYINGETAWHMTATSCRLWRFHITTQPLSLKILNRFQLINNTAIDISILNTFQYWSHFNTERISILNTFQLITKHTSPSVIVLNTYELRQRAHLMRTKYHKNVRLKVTPHSY